MLFAAVCTIILGILYLVAPKNRPPLWASFLAMAWFAVCWTIILHKQV